MKLSLKQKEIIQKMKCFFGNHTPREPRCCSQCDKDWYGKRTDCKYCGSRCNKTHDHEGKLIIQL